LRKRNRFGSKTELFLKKELLVYCIHSPKQLESRGKEEANEEFVLVPYSFVK